TWLFGLLVVAGAAPVAWLLAQSRRGQGEGAWGAAPGGRRPPRGGSRRGVRAGLRGPGARGDVSRVVRQCERVLVRVADLHRAVRRAEREPRQRERAAAAAARGAQDRAHGGADPG